ncbi:hypothetical protein EZV62_004594 [Acer yangbiense]|uniref:Aminotransferase-like plant mobile domain-containing protein n=1 Tax=Acer yangbiense TaxID=1000413 RepID=A0A5C7IKP5_9ROSI|nr:hypothetical protein EZV62_004594 [Acer yangbiense]
MLLHNIKATDVKVKKSTFSTRCTPDRFSFIVPKLSKEQLDAVGKIGFGSLLELCCGRLRRELCKYLIDNFDITNHSLNINDNKIVLNPSMLAKTMGVIDGSLIVNLKGNSNHIEKLKSKYCIESNGLPLHKIEKKHINLTTTNEEFKVTFSLYALGTVFCPTTEQFIKSSYLHHFMYYMLCDLVSEVKKIKHHLNLNDVDKNNNPKKQTEGPVTKDKSNASASKQHPSTPPKQQQPKVDIS